MEIPWGGVSNVNFLKGKYKAKLEKNLLLERMIWIFSEKTQYHHLSCILIKYIISMQYSILIILYFNLQGGWFSGLSGIIQKVIPRGPNEMILPDDSKKSVRSHTYITESA